MVKHYTHTCGFGNRIGEGDNRDNRVNRVGPFDAPSHVRYTRKSAFRVLTRQNPSPRAEGSEVVKRPLHDTIPMGSNGGRGIFRPGG